MFATVIPKLSSWIILNKDPTVWLGIASPANTCILPSLEQDMTLHKMTIQKIDEMTIDKMPTDIIVYVCKMIEH